MKPNTGSHSSQAATGTHASPPRKGQARAKYRRGLEEIEPDCAFVDVAANEHWVCAPEGRSESGVRRFGAFTCDLREIAAWLKSCDVRLVGMESTGVYWVQLYQVLEDAGFEVVLVNARQAKNVKGRPKTDRHDCQWGQRLLRCGLLRGSFRPEGLICQARSIWRMRERRVQDASQATQRMHKALREMNLLLSKALSDIVGETGIRIIEAILAGERDPAALAKLRDKRVRASEATVAKALEGDYRREQLFLLGDAYAQWRFHIDSLASYDAEIADLLGELPDKVEVDDQRRGVNAKACERARGKSAGAVGFDSLSLVQAKCGVDLSAIPGISSSNALGLLCETGADMSAWPDEKHFSSWLSLTPCLSRSAGRQSSSATVKSASRAAARFRQAATCVRNSDCFLGEFFRRMRSRKGPASAITATAHKLARIYYLMLRDEVAYREPDLEDHRRSIRQAQLKRLKRKAHKLGMVVSAEKGSA